MAAAVGVVADQFLLPQWPWWAWVLLTAALLGLYAWLTVWWARREAPDPRAILTVRDGDGEPPLLKDVHSTSLGGHPSTVTGIHIPRDVTGDVVDALLAEAAVVIVAGARLAGSSTVLVDAATAVLDEHRVLVLPEDPTPEQVHAGYDLAGGYGTTGRPAVLWLERASLPALAALAALPSTGPATGRVQVVATAAPPDPLELTGAAATVWHAATRIDVGPLSAAEEARLRAEPGLDAAVRALEEGERRVGRLFVALDQARDALTDRGDRGAEVALLRLATDWDRTGTILPLTRADVEMVYPRYWSRATGGQASRAPKDLREAAVRSLTSPDPDGLVPAWITRTAPGDRWQAHPLLALAADDLEPPHSWTVEDVTWQRVLERADQAERRRLGLHHLAQGNTTLAASLLEHIDDVPLEACLQLTQTFVNNEDADRARTWLHRVIGHDHPDHTLVSWVTIGDLEHEEGDPDRAREAYQHVIDADDPELSPHAWVNLGVVEREQGRLGPAREAYQRAVDTGDLDVATLAWMLLGDLEHERGDPDKARQMYRHVIDANHPEYSLAAWLNLGSLEREQGRLDLGREAFQQVVDADDPEISPVALQQLGDIEREQCDLDRARDAYQRAIATGHPDAAPAALLLLGGLEFEDGRIGPARDALTRAIESGHPETVPDAWVTLGELERSLRDTPRAREAYRNAITEDAWTAASAWLGLGNVEWAEDNPGLAREYFWKVLDSGREDIAARAWVNLGNAEQALREDPDRARYAYQQAIDSGDPLQVPRAWFNLGRLERDVIGDDQAARDAYQRAVDSGEPKYGTEARQALAEIDEQERQTTAARDRIRRGY